MLPDSFLSPQYPEVVRHSALLICGPQGWFCGIYHPFSCQTPVRLWCSPVGRAYLQRYTIFQGKSLGPMSSLLPLAKSNYTQLTYIAEVLYSPLIFTVKLAILLQVQHIFAITSKLRFYLVQSLIWSNACWYFAYTFIVAFACTPTAKSWDFELRGHCISSNSLVALATIPSVVSDLVILILPISWVWKLQMARWRKFEVSLIFAMGLM